MNTKDIWLVDFNPTVGAELKKKRPAVIVNEDSVGILPLRVIVPLTEWNERYNSADWLVKVPVEAENGLSKDSAADCFQVKSVSTDRFDVKIGVVSDEIHTKIKVALTHVLGL